MSAFPPPPHSRVSSEEEIKQVGASDLKKNLLSEFNTPAVVSKRVSRLSANFGNLPTDYIKVFLRLRPFTEQEKQDGEDRKCLKISDDSHILTAMAPKESKIFKVSNRGIGESVRHFTFTKIFDDTTNQTTFYQETAHPLVKQFIDGQDGLIFTYGVTNSGKTYTLQGCPGNEGIIPQAIEVLFDEVGDKMLQDVPFIPKMAKNIHTLSNPEKARRSAIKKQVLSMADDEQCSFIQKTVVSSPDVSMMDSSCNTTNASEDSKDLGKEHQMRYAIFVSFVELYRELVYDLLVPVTDDRQKPGRSRPVLVIADDKKGVSYIKGMREIQVSTPQELLKVFYAGRRNLHVAATKLNKDSSRSHCIFTVTLIQVMDTPNPHRARISKMSFCDLAGSERANKTGEAGDRLKEAGNINNSLMKLGMCIENLRHNQKYSKDKTKQRAIFFRESKLTRLFRNYLLGDGRACMIVNANMCASGFDETVHVLKFSAIAREVQLINKPKVPRPKARTMGDDEILPKPDKNTRMTIGWEKKLSPIRDMDETEEGQDEYLSGDEESDEESDAESTQLDETMVECDVSYWQEREKKYLGLIDMLKKALLDEKQKSKDKEKMVRDQCAQFMQNQLVEIEESHEEHIEDTINTMTEEQKKRMQIMANLSNIDMKEMKEGYEKRIWDLTAKNTALEKELEDCKEQIMDGENKAVSLDVEMNNVKMELDKKCKEVEALRRQSKRSSIMQSHAGSKEVEDLMNEIEEGKNLIGALVEQEEEYRQQIEASQENAEKLQERLTELQENTKEVISQEVKREIEKYEKKLESLEKDLENSNREIKNIESMSQEMIKNRGYSSGDIIIFEEEKQFKYTEGMLRYLNEDLNKKEEQIQQLTTDFEKELDDKQSVKDKLSSSNLSLEVAIMESDFLREKLSSYDKVMENLLIEMQILKNTFNQKFLSDDTEDGDSVDLFVAPPEVKDLEKALEEKKKLVADLLSQTKNTGSETSKIVENSGNALVIAKKEKLDIEDKLRNCRYEQMSSAYNTVFADLKSMLTKKDSLLHNLKAEKDMMDSEKQKVENDLKESQKHAEEGSASLIEKLEKLKKTVEAAESEKLSLMDDLKLKRQEAEKQSEDIEKLNQKLEEAQKIEGKVQELQMKEQTTLNIKSDLEKQVTELESDLKDSKNVITDLKRQIEDQKEETQKITDQVKELQTSEQTTLNVKSDLERQVTELENDLKDSKNIITDLKKQIDDQKEEAQKIADQVKELEMREQTTLNIKSNLEKQLKDQENQLEDSKSVITDLQKRIDDQDETGNAISKAEGELKRKVSEVEKLNKDLEKAQESHSKVMQNLNDVRKELRENVQQNDELNKQLRDQEKDLECTREKNTALENDVASKDQEMESLKKRFETTQKESSNKIAKFQKDIADSKKSYKELESFIKEKEKKLQRMEKEARMKADENKDLSQKLKDAEKRLKSAQDEAKSLAEQRDSMSKARDASDKEKSDLEDALEQKQKELEKLQTTFNNFKTKAESHMEEVKVDLKTEAGSAKNRLQDEIQNLQADLAQNKKALQDKEKEIATFRENRDKIVKALEIQMSNDKACNEKLRADLDTQISEIVQLKSQNAALKAENTNLEKQLNGQEKSAAGPISSPRRSISAADVSSSEPVLRVDLSPLPAKLDRSVRLSRSVSLNSKDTEQADDESSPKVQRTDSKRSQKRTSSTLRKTKRKARPATPLPEAVSEDDFVESTPIKSETRKRLKRGEGSLKNEEQGVLDDSELLKETGNARCFPEPVLELDATPNLNKKEPRTRKRKAKKLGDTDSDAGWSVRKSVRVKTRARAAANTNNSNSKVAEENPGSPTFSVSKNLAQVGSLIRDSPIGTALKRFEEAISPASKSPKQTTERSTRRGKRRVQLRPDDISSPLEATPPADVRDPISYVKETPARMMKRLRSRK